MGKFKIHSYCYDYDLVNALISDEDLSLSYNFNSDFHKLRDEDIWA